MENLDHWNYADTFTAIEAACLIKGINPNDDPAIDEKRLKPIIDRMRKDFDTTCWTVLCAAYDGEASETLRKYSDKGLLSNVIDELISDVATDNNNMDLLEFYAAKRAQEEEQEKFPQDSEYIDIDYEMEKYFPFHDQKFSRRSLQKWIKESNFQSAYTFANENFKSDKGLEKPIETRERNTLLIIIAALCKKSGYDYKDHSKTSLKIFNDCELLGCPTGLQGISNHLKKIPDALEARSK
ncbi:MAG: hypothetical protein V4448_17225 [Pseudomonadota bacterium]